MILVKPQFLLVAVVLLAALLLLQVPMPPPVTRVPIAPPTIMTNPSLFKSIRFENVDPNICAKAQELAKSKDPCRWIIDRSKNILKLVVGTKTIGDVQYWINMWEEVEPDLRNAIEAKAPALVGRAVVTEWVWVRDFATKQGMGTYIFNSGNELLQSGFVRVVVDAENWIKPGINVPNYAEQILPGIWLFITGWR